MTDVAEAEFAAGQYSRPNTSLPHGVYLLQAGCRCSSNNVLTASFVFRKSLKYMYICREWRSREWASISFTVQT